MKCSIALVTLTSLVQCNALKADSIASASSKVLLNSWSAVLESSVSSVKDTPVTRVVNLLKSMSKKVTAEMDEDESLFRKLQCWCNDNEYEKREAIDTSSAKIEELKSSIESLSGSTAELRTNIQELETEVSSDKKALAEATALREKQLSEFHEKEKDDVQAIENLKAAIEVLAKHHGPPPESTVDGGAIFKSERDSWATFLQTVSEEHSPSQAQRSFDTFMRDSGISDGIAVDSEVKDVAPPKSRFLQQGINSLDVKPEWSEADTEVVKRGMRSASAFVQSKQSSFYYPAYFSRSGEIVGVMKQLKDEMERDLSESQKTEAMRAAAFAELRSAKTEEIRDGENRAEQKEDQLANEDNLLAESKEDLGQESATLASDTKFLKSVKEQCSEANTNYQSRKASWLEEIKAITETIEILQTDVARDAMSGTFNFLQVASKGMQASHKERRERAAMTLRHAAKMNQDPQLSILATSVQLDSFTRVKKAIDDMIAMLRQQQSDEVKKNDWCKAELQENEMNTAKEETHKEDLEAKIAKLESEIKALEEAIANAKAQIAQLQLNLQRATEERKKENLDFQKNVADQTVTIEVLHKALDRLAKYYDLVQTGSSAWTSRQTPPVPQKEYKKSKSAPGIMEMIEKVIYDARELMSNSKKSESEAQAAYEQNIADTNDSVHALQKEIFSKTGAVADTKKDKRLTTGDHKEALLQLESLAKYNAELHVECDYILRNFDVRQRGRADEVVALQQAKQILDGATLE